MGAVIVDEQGNEIASGYSRGIPSYRGETESLVIDDRPSQVVSNGGADPSAQRRSVPKLGRRTVECRAVLGGNEHDLLSVRLGSLRVQERWSVLARTVVREELPELRCAGFVGSPDEFSDPPHAQVVDSPGVGVGGVGIDGR